MKSHEWINKSTDYNQKGVVRTKFSIYFFITITWVDTSAGGPLAMKNHEWRLNVICTWTALFILKTVEQYLIQF
jgi:hypothetical protein